jgi:hypothetical protein
MATYQEELLEQCRKLDGNLKAISGDILGGYDNSNCNPTEDTIRTPVKEIIKLKHKNPQEFTKFFESHSQYKKFISEEISKNHAGSYGRQLRMIQLAIQRATPPSDSMSAAKSMNTSKIGVHINKDAYISNENCTIT